MSYELLVVRAGVGDCPVSGLPVCSNSIGL